MQFCQRRNPLCSLGSCLSASGPIRALHLTETSFEIRATALMVLPPCHSPLANLHDQSVPSITYGPLEDTPAPGQAAGASVKGTQLLLSQAEHTENVGK